LVEDAEANIKMVLFVFPLNLNHHLLI